MKFKVLFISIFLGLLATDSFYSQTIVWDGETSTEWTTATNWVGDVAPLVSEDIQISTAASGNYPILTANTSLANLVIDAGTSVQINAGIKFDVNGDIDVNGTLNLNGTGAEIDVSNWDDETGTLTFSGNSKVRLSGTGNINSDPSNVLRNLTLKVGAGTYTATSDLSLFGNVTIRGGTTLDVSSFTVDAISSGAYQFLNEGTILFSHNNGILISNADTFNGGSGAITFTADGTLKLKANSVFSTGLGTLTVYFVKI
jgi:hypothetical protein